MAYLINSILNLAGIILCVVGIIIIYNNTSKIINAFSLNKAEAGNWAPFQLKKVKNGLLLICIGLVLQFGAQIISTIEHIVYLMTNQYR